MYQRILRHFTSTAIMFALAAVRVLAQPCADTQPVITGAQVVSNNQQGVIYSTPNIPGHTYSWTVTGGTVVSGTGTSQISVNWGNVGTGTISLLETNPAVPCSTTVNKSIAVQPLLIAYFYYTNTSCYGDIITFHDTSVYDVAMPITSWHWTFGDGGTSNLQNPQHQYLPPWNQTYPVMLVVKNSINYTDTIYDAVYVNPNQYIPTAVFSSTIPNCTYQPVQFDASGSTTPAGSSPIIHYYWDFGDPAGANNILNDPTEGGLNKTPTHIFSAPGTYNVYLEITNKLYCKGFLTHQIVIQQSVPKAKFAYSSPTCLGNAVYFTDQSTFPTGKDIVKWEWNFGDGTSPVTINSPAAPSMAHTFPGLGPYHVQLVVTNNLGCVDTTFKNVSLDPSPHSAFTQSSQCFGDTVQFTDQSIPNGGPPIAAYYWNFGDIGSGFFNTSVLQNPTHKFSAPGNFIITMVTTNTSGCPDTLRDTIEIHASPFVNYTWNFGGLNNEVHFHIDSASMNMNIIGNMVLWNFGDGYYGYGWDPIHIFPAPGTFNVTCSVTDTLGCKGAITKVILVPSIPVAFFSSNSPVCDGDSVCFINLSSVPTPPFGFIKTWIWNFGDGAPQDTIHFPNNPNVCHLYAIADTFTVTLKVIDNNGFTDSYPANVIVMPDPVANFQASIACKNMIVNFTDASTANGGGNIISRYWDFGDPLSGTDNTSQLLNPTHIFSNGCGKYYNVRLVIVNFNNCRDTMIKPVWVHCPPPVDFTFDTACLHQLVHFNANSGITQVDSIVSWSWYFGDGSPVVNDPIATSHLYMNVGTYIVTLTVIDHHGCVHDTSHTVRVNPLPVPAFTWASPNCQGSPLQFTDHSYVPSQYTGYIAKWRWHFDDGTPDTTITIPNSADVIHTFANPVVLTHNVSLTVWTGDSCTAFIVQTVTSLPHPVALFHASPTNCQGQTVQFWDDSQTNGGGTITSWQWSFGDPPSGSDNGSLLQNPLHTFNTGNAWYKVSLLVTNGNTCHDTISHWIYIRGLPPVDFTYDSACLNQMVHFNGNSGVTMIDSIVTWSWNFGDGAPPDPTPVTTSHLYTATGTYTTTLTVTDNHGCIGKKSHTVHVNPLPVSNFTWNTPVCESKLVQFTDQSSVTQGYLAKWRWDFNDGTSPVTITLPNPQNVTHLFPTTSMNFTVRLTVWTNDSCSTFIDKTVSLTPAPIANFIVLPTTCTDQTVHFQDNSQTNGGGLITTWLWNFGDPGSGGPNNTSTLPNPIHTYGSPGPYVVHMTVTNATGCDSTKIDTINIHQLPVAKFTADTACLGNPTQFTDISIPNSLGGIVSYLWNFGDSQTGTLPDPPHTYTQAGVFNVTLTIVNSNGCIKDTTESVLVNPLPIPGFTYSTPNCVGAPVFYTNTSTTPTGYLGHISKWVWHFGDGTADQIIWWPASADISHVFAPGGSIHTVRLTVETGDSCQAFIEHTLTSIPSPLANFSFPTSNCASLPTQFLDGSAPNGGGPIVTWWWDFGDPTSGNLNNSSAQNPIHIWMGGLTSYDVTLIVTNGSNCSDTIGYTVSVDALPVASFTADTVCFGNPTTFTNASTGGTITTYLWQFGDGSTSPNASPTYQYAQPGTFNVTLTVTTDHGCHKDTTRQVLVIPTPTANFSASSPTCAGTDSVHFTDLSSAPYGSIKRWYWDFGDGSNMNILWPANPNVYHKYTQGGTFNVSLTVHTGDSCTNTKINPVVVQWAPLPNFDFDPVRCEHTPVQFTDLSQPNGGAPLADWSWDFGDPSSGNLNTSGMQNPTHPFSTFGNFIVKLTVTNANGCHDTISKTVSIAQAPDAAFTADTACAGNITTFTDQSVANVGTITSWLWNFGDPSSINNTSTLQNPTHSYSGVGSYMVTLHVTNTNTCGADTAIWVLVNPKPVAMFQFGSVCVHDSTQFTDLSIAPGSTVIGWYWEFGDGFTSTIQNPYHTYQLSGTYPVTETVTNLQGCNDSITIPVIARPTPVAAFTYTNFFCPAGQVNFQDESHGMGAAIVGHHWIFEPGQTSDWVNPSHVFTITDTTYAVMEIITDNFGCQDTVVDSVFVKPGFLFKFNADTVCFKQISHFSPVDLASGDSLYSVKWNFGDPQSGPSNVIYGYNVAHTFSHPGTFTVMMKAWDADNCVDSILQDVIIYALPQPVFHYNRIPCDSNLYFHDSTTIYGSGNIASWIWNWGDGQKDTIYAPGPGDASHLYVNVGFYKVILMVTNSHGCSDTTSMEVQRIPCIQAKFVHDTMLCARYPIAFSDSSLPIALINRWQWKWGDGTPDTIYFAHDAVLHHTFPNGGTFPVRLIINATISGTPIADSNTQALVIHPTPLTYFSNPAVCLNQITLFRDTSTTFGAKTINWNWNFGESYSVPNDTSTFKNPTHKYDSAGVFDVKLVVMNKYGCKDSLTKTTRVYGIPVAKFSNSVACSGNPTYFYDKSILGDTILGYWFWRFGDNSSKTDSSLVQNPNHIYDTTGIYNVKLLVRDRNGCMDTTDTVVTVNVTPTSSFTFTDNTNGMPGKLLMDNKSTGANAYFWDFGNGQTSTDENPIVTYSQDGTYIIKLISNNQFNCSDTTYYKYEVLFRGLFIPNAFSPSNSNLAVRLFKPVGINIKEYHIQVFDNWGHLVWESIKLDSQGKPEEGWDGTLNGQLMPMGVYMWKASAIFIDDTIWQGSDIGKGDFKTFGTVTLLR